MTREHRCPACRKGITGPRPRTKTTLRRKDALRLLCRKCREKARL